MATDYFGSSKSSSSSKKNTAYFGDSSAQAKKQAAIAKANADSGLTDINQLSGGTSSAAKPPKQPEGPADYKGIGGALKHVRNAIADVAKVTAKAGVAVARPAVDVATGQGGKLVHDTATLGNDVGSGAFTASGRFINQAKAEYDQLNDVKFDATLNSLRDKSMKKYQDAVKTGDQNKIAEANDELDAVAKAQKAQKAANDNHYKEFTRGHGGLFNVGTITNEAESRQGTAKGAIKIAAGTAAVAPEIIPFAKGLTAASAASKAAKVAEAADKAEQATRAVKAAEFAANAGKAAATNAVFGAGTSALNQYVDTGHVDPKQLARDTAGAGVMGLTGHLIHEGGGQVLDKVFKRNPTEVLDEVKASMPEPKTEQKLLGPGAPKLPSNDSTSVVKMSDKEWTDRFKQLSDNYDKETKTATKLSPLKRGIALDDIHDRHVTALEQLNDQYANPKPQPTGFQVVKPGTPVAPVEAALKIPKEQNAQLVQRVEQIDKIISKAQTDGSPRTANELRSLMRERDNAQAIVDGHVPHEAVYGKGSNIQPLSAVIGTAKEAATGAAGKAGAAVESIISKIPKVAAGDTKGAPLARNYVVQKYQSLIAPVKSAAAELDKHDLSLIDQIEGNHTSAVDAAAHLETVAKNAHDPEQFKKVVGLMREGYNARLASDTTLGRDVGVRHNYLPHYFDRTDAATANKLDELDAQKAFMVNNAQPGYTKPRTIENYAKANELGLKRQNANAVEDFEQAMNAASYEHGSQALRAALEQAHPGQVHVGEFGKASDGAQYDQLKIAGGQNLSLPKDLAAKYNARAPYEYKDSNVGEFLKGYDVVNSKLKSAKLGGGLFHGFTTMLTTGGQQLASLNLARHPVENLKVVAGTLSKKVHEANVAKLAANGDKHLDRLSTVDRMALSGVTTMPGKIAADVSGKVLTKAGESKFNPIKQIHDMVFQRQIPEAKALMFEQATKHLNTSVPGDLEKMRAAARAVNNMGGINRAVDGLNPQTFQHVSRALLATDFTEGKFRTLFAAVAKGGPEGKIARQMVVGKSLLAAVPGVAAAVVAGKISLDKPKELAAEVGRQIVDPQVPLGSKGTPTKSNPGGTPQSAHLPATFISEITKIIKPALDHLSTDKWKGVKDYASARLAALPALGVDLKENQDFYGNPIYGKDAAGNPISAKDTALNIGEQVAPIPATQVGKTTTGAQNAKTAALNVAGFNVKADSGSDEAAHSKAVSDFFDTLGQQNTAKSKVSKQITQLVMSGNVNQAKRIAQEWNATVDARVTPFRSKYSKSYNPAWDKEFKKLFISTSDNAFTQRTKSGKASAALLR